MLDTLANLLQDQVQCGSAESASSTLILATAGNLRVVLSESTVLTKCKDVNVAVTVMCPMKSLNHVCKCAGVGTMAHS